MALPEDDVEEIDPEPALARILDHEHDALVVGPGLRPGLATAELVRRAPRGPGEAAPAPIVLDAEALRSLATMDDWWDGRPPTGVLTPHAGEFAPVAGRRAAGSRRRTATWSTTTTARVAAARDAAPRWGQVVVLKGARTVIAAPDGERRHRAVREPGPRHRRHRRRPGRARSARCSPRACRRSMRPGSGSTCTVWPATPSASGSATPACWPPTCPTRSPSPGAGWRRRRARAGRQAARVRGARRRGPAARDRPEARRRRPSPRERRRRLTAPDRRRASDRGPAGRGRAAAAAPDRLARDRPRRAGREPGRRCAAGRSRDAASTRSSRPTPTATAPMPGRAGPRGRRRGRLLRRDLRRGPGAPGRRHHRAHPRPLPGPGRRSRRRPPRRGSRSRAGDLGPSRRSLAAARRRAAAADRPLDLQLEVETGLGRGGVAPGRPARGRRPHRGQPRACGWPACGPTSRPPRMPPRPRRQLAVSTRP